MSKHSSEMPEEESQKNGSRRKRRKPFRLEYRMRPKAGRGALFTRWEEWSTCWKKYETAEDRDKALNQLAKSDQCFEYRIPERE